MKQKLKSKIIKKDVTDLKGYTITKGTKIFIIKEWYWIIEISAQILFAITSLWAIKRPHTWDRRWKYNGTRPGKVYF